MEVIEVMVRIICIRIPAWYFKENWGAPFIVGFMLLLMIAAASLSMGLAVLANEVAIYAYYALVVGVILQLVCFLKCNKRNGEKEL
jgi:heme/copper-type cytochrome/quinol oxidase subunit 4